MSAGFVVLIAPEGFREILDVSESKL